MSMIVNQNIFADKWKQVEGRVKKWWGKLTDDDLMRIHGRVEELIGVVQERYGYTREKAEMEVARFLHALKH